MFRSSFPRPASFPVHVTGMLVVPESGHTGTTPSLKCGLEATATADNAPKTATRVTTHRMRVLIRIVRVLLAGGFDRVTLVQRDMSGARRARRSAAGHHLPPLGVMAGRARSA